MQIENHDLEEVVEICKTAFEERITLKEARTMATELMAL